MQEISLSSSMGLPSMRRRVRLRTCAGAVEAVAADLVLLIVLVGQSVGVGHGGHGLMERGVEHGDHGGCWA